MNNLCPVRLAQSELFGEIGRRIKLTIYENLMKLNIEKDFLLPFQVQESVHPAYIGLGKLIDAAVGFAVYTDDVKILEFKKRLVAETIKTQDSDGYIGVLVPESRMWFRYDMHEIGYLIVGLTNDYKYFGEKASLRAARKLADFVINRWSAEPARWPGSGNRKDLFAVRTGFDNGLLELYEQTEDSRYMDFLVNFQLFKLPEWNVEIKKSTDYMADERHAYVYMSLCVAQLQLYDLNGDSRLLSQTEKAIRFLTRQDGMLTTGSCGMGESWHDNQDCKEGASESCATAYLVRMTEHLMRTTGRTSLGDLIERTIYNALFAAQSPDGRQLRYFCAVEGPRKYYNQDIWCCPNNFRRIIAALPAMVYYRSVDGVTVNLYTASTTTVDLDDGRNVTIRQKTEYPTSGQVKITITPSMAMEFPLQLRIPHWCSQTTYAINDGTSVNVCPNESLLKICRVWQPGDKVTLNMSMPWRLIRGRKLQEGKVALMRGPVVYCIGVEENTELLKTYPEPGNLIIDPTTFGEPSPDTTVRPGGLKVTAKAWPADGQTESAAPLSVVFTEFVDPSGIATYFHVPDLTRAIDDELMATTL